MTPAEHIVQAELQIQSAAEHWDDHDIPGAQTELMLGVLHALIAIAVESGVPHQTTTPAVS